MSPRRTPQVPAAGRTGGGAAPAATVLQLVAVIRVSRKGKRGRDGGSFLSPDQQRERILMHAKLIGAVIVAWFDETDSVSGKTTDRRGLNAAMDLILSGAADGLIVAKVDRFARTVEGGLAAVGRLRRAGKRFIAAADAIDTHDGNKVTKATLTFLFMMAEWQLDGLTESWADAVERQIAAGIANFDKYGYSRCVKGGAHAPGCTGNDDSRHRHLIPDPDRRKWVKLMFTRRAAGTSWSAIADELTAKGAPTPSGQERWVHTGVRSIVTSRVYRGELASGELVNTSAHDPLVTEDLWRRANPQRPPAERSAAQGFMLTGLIRCASCGAKLRGNTRRHKGVAYRYYRCPASFRWGKCPAPVIVSADAVEALVLERFERDYVGRRRLQAVRSTTELDEAVEAERSAEAELRAFAVAPSTLQMRELLGEDAYEDAMGARLARVRAAQEKRACVEGALLGAQLPANLAEVWATMPDDARRALVAEVFPVVAVAHVARNRWVEDDVAGRVRIFDAADRDLPSDLPGKRRAGDPPNRIRRIDVSVAGAVAAA